MTESTPPIIVPAQFVDDIRVEFTGKMIVIGQYSGEMTLMPGASPVDRLAFLITARWPRGYVPNSPNVRIEIPGQAPMLAGPLEIPPLPLTENDESPFSGTTLQAVIQTRCPPLRIGDLIDVWATVTEALPAADVNGQKSHVALYTIWHSKKAAAGKSRLVECVATCRARTTSLHLR